MSKILAAVALWLILPHLASAQDTDKFIHGQGYGVVGFGGSTYAKGAVTQLSFGGEAYHIVGLGIEVGHAWWTSNNISAAWLASGQFTCHFRRKAPKRGLDPFVLGGGGLYAPTMHGEGRGTGLYTVGGGINWWLSDHSALRFEFRNYWSRNALLSPGPQYATFRVGLTFR